MLIPYGTDAPVYHLPFATIGLVVVNVIVFILQLIFPEQIDPFLLDFETISPIQWLTCMFLHADIFHILGNMLFLAIFGLIVEGKVGWWRFLLIYLAVGLVASAVIQCVMFNVHSTGKMMGASCAIFGILAVAMVWRPENEIFFKWIFIIFLRPHVFSFEVPVLITSFGFIAFNFLVAAFTGFPMSTATAHLIGAVPGLVIGLLMVVFRLVDCEGFDLISQLRGRRGQKPPPTLAEQKEMNRQKEQAKREAHQHKANSMEMINRYVASGHYEQAIKRFEMLKRKDHELRLPEATLLNTIKGFVSSPTGKEKAIPLMESYLQDYTKQRIPVTLSLARMYVVVQERPRKGLDRLKTIKNEPLNPQQQEFFRKLVSQAKKMIADGILEIDET